MEDILLLIDLMEKWWNENKDNTVCKDFREINIFNDEPDAVIMCCELMDEINSDLTFYEVNDAIMCNDFFFKPIYNGINELDELMLKHYGEEYDNNINDVLSQVNKIIEYIEQ